MYDAPAKNVPIANFTGRLGCLVPSFCHNNEIIGANNKINNGLIDWKIASPKFVFQPNKFNFISEMFNSINV